MNPVLLPAMRKWQPVKTRISNPLSRLAEACREYEKSCLLYSGQKTDSGFKMLAGFGHEDAVSVNQSGNAFNQLREFLSSKNDYCFGHFSYDLKNETENIQSENPDRIGFPVLHFFRPENIVLIHENGDAETGTLNEKDGGNSFFKKHAALAGNTIEKTQIQQRTSREEYLQHVSKLKAHIHRGDIYEINYCIEFFAEKISIDPPAVFVRLCEIADAPFSALYRDGDHWLICASPERFLKKTGSKIISQPIKGTRPRGKSDAEDKALAEELRHDEKEKCENVMIVDLVRNDLSKFASRGSVKVDELFGIYSFKTVHQMISTVSAEIPAHVSNTDAIRAAYPMGSMTGAPKLRAMQLAETHENVRRGLYSGALGYFTPEGDFDFNVVIRSIQYNAATGYLSFMVGSAITANADPEKEYEECLLKAKALFEVLGAK